MAWTTGAATNPAIGRMRNIMAYFFHIADDASGPRLATVCLGHLDRSYVLDDRTRCPVYDHLVWCSACRTFCAAERIPPLADIDAKLADLRRGEGTTYRRMTQPGGLAAELQRLGLATSLAEAKMTAEEIAEWSTVRRWRIMRRTGPKCLACGSGDIIPFELGDGPQPHPAGGHQIRADGFGHVSLVEHALYTVEGDRIEHQ